MNCLSYSSILFILMFKISKNIGILAKLSRPVACGGGPGGRAPPAFCLAPLLFCIGGLSSMLGPPMDRAGPAAKLSRYGAEAKAHPPSKTNLWPISNSC